MATQHIRYKLRGYTAAQWTTANPILLEREPGIETDTRKVKYGDGVTAWNSLAYAGASGGGLADIVDDTTPQLGGNLDLNGHTVGAATAADLTKLHALTADSTELNYVDGVTSAIQTQLDAKVASASLGASILAAVLTGLSTATNQAVAATDTVLQAFGYLQKQITDLIATVATKAKLNTSANDPTGTFSADELHCNTTSGQLFWASDANTSRQVFLSGINTIGTSDIAAGAVTLAKQADMATDSVVYRKTAGTGAPEVNTLATLKTDLGLTGTNSGDQTATTVTNTPAGNISATTVQAAINELDTEKQPLDADLTTIAGLTATTDSFMQAKGSAWASRTVAQVKTDLGLTGTNSGDQDLSTYLTQSGSKTGATASGTATYTASLSPAIGAYATYQRFCILFTNANTGAATINLNSLGAKSIVKNGSTALSSGDIPAGSVKELVYDGTNFQIVGDGGGSAASAAAVDPIYSMQNFESQANSSAAVAVANTVYWKRVPVAQAKAVSSIMYRFDTSSASTFYAFGIYSDDGTTKLIDSGAIDGSVNGSSYLTNTPTTTGTVPAGHCIIAWTASSTAIAMRSTSIQSVNTLIANQGTAQMGTAANASTAGVLPSSLGTLTGAMPSMVPLVKFQ